MALPPFRVVVNTFESKPWPVVTHIFHGDTLQQAASFYEAHKKSDSFMRECGEQGGFQGKFKCRNKIFFQRRERKRWITLRELNAPAVRAVPDE